MTELLVAGGVMLALGGMLSTVLAIANKKLFVFEDPRIDEVEEMLPGANCGACGQAGCRAFAEATVKGETSPAKCSVNSPDMVAAIAAFLGVEAGAADKRVARLACAGGNHVARNRALYEGLPTCRAATLVAGGGKGCSWGCLGLGDCATACTFDAITMDEHGLPVVNEDKCTACGDCVAVCPKALFSIHPLSHQLWVACKSELAGDLAESECAVACTACGRCAMDAEPAVVSIQKNLAVVDYSRNHKGSKKAISRCPTGAIVWLDPKEGVVKGAQAKRIVRKTPLPLG